MNWDNYKRRVCFKEISRYKQSSEIEMKMRGLSAHARCEQYTEKPVEVDQALI